MSRDHRKLRVFQDAHALAVETYRQTLGLPRDEWFGLRSQMRRAAVSVASNLVEGSARPSQDDYLRFLHIALSSGRELRYLICLTEELGLLPGVDWAGLGERSPSPRSAAPIDRSCGRFPRLGHAREACGATAGLPGCGFL